MPLIRANGSFPHLYVPVRRLPIGIRFSPTDEELITHYLARKHSGQPLPTNLILEDDLYSLDPWELPDVNPSLYKENEWYFFAITRRLPNECLTATGHWTYISQEKEIFDRRGTYLGSRFTMLFVVDNAIRERFTEWRLDEYHLPYETKEVGEDVTQTLPPPMLVVCRIYKDEDACTHSDNESEVPLADSDGEDSDPGTDSKVDD
ncbi:hypothetical protein AMTRI_Chr10g60 [Amborella trichopoda]